MLLSGEFWQKRICRRKFDKSLLAGLKCGKAASWRGKRSQDEPLLEGRGVPRARWRCLCHSQNRRRRSGELFQTNLVADWWTSRALQDWHNGNFCIGYGGHVEIVDILRMVWTHQYYGIFEIVTEVETFWTSWDFKALAWQCMVAGCDRTTIDFVQTINCKHKDHPRCFHSCANFAIWQSMVARVDRTVNRFPSVKHFYIMVWFCGEVLENMGRDSLNIEILTLYGDRCW